jgi:hypothetical protein
MRVAGQQGCGIPGQAPVTGTGLVVVLSELGEMHGQCAQRGGVRSTTQLTSQPRHQVCHQRRRVARPVIIVDDGTVRADPSGRLCGRTPVANDGRLNPG